MIVLETAYLLNTSYSVPLADIDETNVLPLSILARPPQRGLIDIYPPYGEDS